MFMLKSHPEIMSGEVCFAGTRIPIECVWSFAAAGFTAEQIKKEYPTLDMRDIVTAVGMVEWHIPE